MSSMTEIQIIIPRFQGGTVPCNSCLYQTKYPVGLRCACNNRNSIFHTLSRWKNHCKGKRHLEWTQSLDDDEPIDGNQRDLVLELKSQLKDAQKINVRLSNDASVNRLVHTRDMQQLKDAQLRELALQSVIAVLMSQIALAGLPKDAAAVETIYSHREREEIIEDVD